MSYRHMVTLYSDLLVAGLLATALLGAALAAALWWVLYRTRACPGGRVDVVRPPGVSSAYPATAGPQDQVPAPAMTPRPTAPVVPDGPAGDAPATP